VRSFRARARALARNEPQPAFWQTVEPIFPEFREARHTLKHHPPELLPAPEVRSPGRRRYQVFF
jgi:hypothetical protein